MLHSKLYTSIRLACFGAATLSTSAIIGTNGVAQAAVANTVSNINDTQFVHNIRHFDYKTLSATSMASKATTSNHSSPTPHQQSPLTKNTQHLTQNKVALNTKNVEAVEIIPIKGEGIPVNKITDNTHHITDNKTDSNVSNAKLVDTNFVDTKLANTELTDNHSNPASQTKKEQANQLEQRLMTKLIDQAYQPYPKHQVTTPTLVKKVGDKVKKVTHWLDKDSKNTQDKNTQDNDNTANASATMPAKNLDNSTTNHQQAWQNKPPAPHVANTPSSNTSRCDGRWIYPQSINTDGTQPSNIQSNQTQSNTANPAKGGFYAVADYGYYDNDSYAELTGNVTVQQGQQRINADKVVLDLHNKTAKAQGEVMFADGTTQPVPASTETATKNLGSTIGNLNDGNRVAGIVGVADYIDYNTANDTAQAHDIAFASIPLQAHGYAKAMEKVSDSEYNLQDVIFSTCDPANRKWHLEADKIDLNTKTGRGETRHTTLRIKDVPVLYLPYFNFPIDSRRNSGFLLPHASLNTERGFEVSLPYYFNLAPNYDATVTSRIFTDRNPMLTTEFRYLTDGFGEGRVMGSYLPNDKKYQDKDRSSVFYQHHWQSESMPHLTAEAQYNYVSDADYNDDFDYFGVVDSNLNLPRNAKVNYYNDYLNAQLKVETFQSLAATDSRGNRVEDKDRPYAKLPQLTASYRLPKPSLIFDNNELELLDNIHISGEHDSAYFKKSIGDSSDIEKSGFRMYNKLSASYAYERPWGYIEPKVSLQHLYSSYDKDARIANNISEENNSQSVFVPQVSLDAVANFTKQGSPVSWIDTQMGGYQILSPRLKYSYAPYKHQNDIPNFNTRIASINYDQLYADSWFLGHDRLQDLHAITPGVNYRYIDATGLTRLDASMAQQFYLDPGQVTLEKRAVTDKTLFNKDSSGLVTSLSAQPYPDFWLDLNSAVTSNYDLNYITSQMRYQPTTDSQFSVGITERKLDENTGQLPISALTASAVFPINHNWRIISQAQYDYDNDKFLDSMFGVDYEDCCIGFAVYGRRYYNDLNVSDDANQAVMAELRLKGISTGGGQLTRLLSDKIMGIDDVNNRWRYSPDTSIRSSD